MVRNHEPKNVVNIMSTLRNFVGRRYGENVSNLLVDMTRHSDDRVRFVQTQRNWQHGHLYQLPYVCILYLKIKKRSLVNNNEDGLE